MAKLLPAEIESPHSPLFNDRNLIELYAECLGDCLKRGGAFAEEFLNWDAEGASCRVMELAIRFGQVDLVQRISDELDHKYPDDEPAKLLRHVVVAGVKGDMDEAQKTAEELSRRFPKSVYVRGLPQTLDESKKKHSTKSNAP